MTWCHHWYHELGQEALGEKWGTLGCGTAAAHRGGKCGHGNYCKPLEKFYDLTCKIGLFL